MDHWNAHGLLKVEIREDSPVFVVTKPLKIDYTRKD